VKLRCETKETKSVTVIIPCYNGQNYLEKTLESLEQQTCQDFQVICVNDGSTDDTPRILECWKEKGILDMRVIHQENGGVSTARNAGIEAAQSEFLLFLDADDVYHPRYIEAMLTGARNSGADTVYAPLMRDLEKMQDGQVDPKQFCIHEQAQVMDHLMLQMGRYGFYCYLYRRSILMEQGIRFTVGMRYFEDREFNWKYLCFCKSAAWFEVPMYGYRRVDGSTMSGNMTWERAKSGLDGVRRIEAFMENSQCDYLETFRNYLPHRIIWTTLKNCAVRGQRELYDRLGREYPVREAMKQMKKDHSLYVAWTARMYLIAPGLMYHALRVAGRLTE
jgi:glycosyltransferase involved in cell wall biosynthesis